MSEKEQALAIKLLGEWVDRMAAIRSSLSAEEIELLDRSAKFLGGRYVEGPESHGSRRS